MFEEYIHLNLTGLLAELEISGHQTVPIIEEEMLQVAEDF